MAGQKNKDSMPETSDDKRRLDRRTLIKGAAAAGAVGWTAPLIIESMTSPAAAVSTCFEARGGGNLGNTCNTIGNGNRCMGAPTNTNGCSGHAPTFTNNGGGSWTVCVPSGCTISQLFEFCGGSCQTISCSGTRCCTFTACSSLSHFDVYYCCSS